MRRSGRTTRIVDGAIQELFEKGEVVVKDHLSTLPPTQASKFVSDIIRKRLYMEHGGIKLKQGFVTVDSTILVKITIL